MITAIEIATALRPMLVRAPSVGPMRFRHAVVDSRKAGRGDLFVALRGERADGHDFVAHAASRGATGAIVERPVEAELAQYVVPGTLTALQELARQRRLSRPRLNVVAITGSVGKTTTKELVAAVLGTRHPVLKNEGNLNSEIGLPLVLLELTTRHRRAVLEMGMWAPGEIALLCDIAVPEVGIVTNIGPSHMERLGSIEAIADAKAELVESLAGEGVAILNADDPRVAAMAERTAAHVLTYGQALKADVRAEQIVSHGLAGVSFTLAHGAERAPVYSRLPGRAMVHNALAAAAAGIVDGMSVEETAKALSEAQVPTRLVAHRGANGSTLLDDTYNASPASMLAALDLLGELPGRKIAVLGDMRELGAAESDGHREVGRRAAEVADVVYAIGELGRWIGDAAIQAGHDNVHIVIDKAQAGREVRDLLEPDDVVLLKGSRALALETLLADLGVGP
ncbi:MAG TPA: UDP-N-acetylmuramoyl-tripeptide--D-alanyl-D-alanine ligase [Dehalococcoidia bacterium]|nr:UDP-N-acetylmuramoyl-tripeptide--D-alanyl-D-alanine ligase [Dehalococcoidia bacterium]